MMVRLFLFLALSLSIPFGVKEATHGFRLAKLQLDFPSEAKWDFSLDEAVVSLLEQEFTYLDRGAQSYVFESADHKYVVKFLRFDRKREEKKIRQIFESFRLAYEELSEETGLVYLHLNPTAGKLPILRAKDPIGRRVEIALDGVRFAVQKKGMGFEEIFLGARGNRSVMEVRLNQFLDLLEKRCSKGVWNKDPSLKRNFGFLAEGAIELDCGSYRYVAELDQKKEIERYGEKMRKWLMKNDPEMVPYFDACFAMRLRNYLTFSPFLQDPL